jgi:hypothetical protein
VASESPKRHGNRKRHTPVKFRPSSSNQKRHRPNEKDKIMERLPPQLRIKGPRAKNQNNGQKRKSHRRKEKTVTASEIINGRPKKAKKKV